MTEVSREIRAPRRFHFFVRGLRLLFDLVLLVVALLCIGFVVFAMSLDREQSQPYGTADGIVVLTGGVSRIDHAMKLLAQRRAKRVLITGVYVATTKEELKKLASEGDQYFSCCVDIDKNALNTIDNATETSQWVAHNKYGSVIVVTSNYHMPRALAELGRALPGVQLIPYSVVDNNVHLDRWWEYPGSTKLLLSEYLKYLPALGRLAATNLVRNILTGGKKVTEDVPEP
ncbi:MAG: YdcF family protein [Methyloceanibacter sp.]|uniref:YdcF family protein n=1 Tax=Methyloceanibacter sp. TaxID=1965321 RepID=UPI003D9B1A6D